MARRPLRHQLAVMAASAEEQKVWPGIPCNASASLWPSVHDLHQCFVEGRLVRNSSAMSAAVSGACSEHFRITALPAASAGESWESLKAGTDNSMDRR